MHNPFHTLPLYVHLASTRRHSRDRCSQAFPVFCALLLPCIILNETQRTKNGGGLGTRHCILFVYSGTSLNRHLTIVVSHLAIWHDHSWNTIKYNASKCGHLVILQSGQLFLSLYYLDCTKFTWGHWHAFHTRLSVTAESFTNWTLK